MNRFKKILWVENNRDYLDVRSEFIENAGYEVYKASTLEQAMQILRDTWVHLVIVDVRMENDEDNRDKSGLDWAAKELYRSLPKIVLTAHSTYKIMREAMRERENGQQLAKDFLEKDREPEEIIIAIDQAFVNLHLNWDLIVDWKSSTNSFIHLASLIKLDIDNTYLLDRASELEDLFCRLFYEKSRVAIIRILSVSKGKVTLALIAKSENGITESFVVACGKRDVIRQEEENYKSFSPKMVRGTIIHSSAETIHFAAIAYTLIGADLEEITTFDEFYQRNSADEVITVLDYLFDTTLAQWHAQGASFEGIKTVSEVFTSYLDSRKATLTRSELEPRIRTLQEKALYTSWPEFGDSSLNQLFDLIEGSIPISTPFRCGISLKRLRGDNILVDLQGRTWLTDFSQVGRGPVVYDYTSVENVIKFDLLNLSSLLERHKMEELLQTNFGIESETDFGDLASETRKAAQIITHIWQRFVDTVNHGTQHYQVGLLVTAIERVATFEPTAFYTRLEIARYVHSLLSAKILCQNLNSDDTNIEFIFDRPNRSVSVGEKQVVLTKVEFKLLDYLMKNAGKVCSRDELWSEILDDDSDIPYDNALNTHISRLRKKIEPDPANPRFIVTVPGHGYRFTG